MQYNNKNNYTDYDLDDLVFNTETTPNTKVNKPYVNANANANANNNNYKQSNVSNTNKAYSNNINTSNINNSKGYTTTNTNPKARNNKMKQLINKVGEKNLLKVALVVCSLAFLYLAVPYGTKLMNKNKPMQLTIEQLKAKNEIDSKFIKAESDIIVKQQELEKLQLELKALKSPKDCLEDLTEGLIQSITVDDCMKASSYQKVSN